MKTSKIISTIFSFTLIFFMSVTSIANSNLVNTGDNVTSDIKKQIEGNKNMASDMTTVANEFSNLRFDVNKFAQGTASEITEIPAMNSTDYLRFDVNTFDKNDNISDMPVNEFDYLRFDVNHFDNTSVSEMPVI